jgi:hypothetical protein
MTAHELSRESIRKTLTPVADPPRLKLYELSGELAALNSILSLLDGEEYTEAVASIEAQIEAANIPFERKLEGCVGVHKSALRDAEAFETEAEDVLKIVAGLKAAAKRRRDKAGWIKQYMKNCMEEAGLTHAKAGIFSLHVQGNGGPIPIGIDESKLVQDARFWKTIPQPDGDAIRKAIESGETIPGVTVGERGSHLRIS